MILRGVSLVFFCFLTVLGWSQNSDNKQYDTLKLAFPIDEYVLEYHHQKAISEFLFSKDSIISVQVFAFADYLGTDGYNKGLTNRRAKKVKDEIVSLGLSDLPIKLFSLGRQLEKNDYESIGNSEKRIVNVVCALPFSESEASAKEVRINLLSEDFNLNELPVKKPFVMENMYFEGGTPILIKESIPVLQRLKNQMLKYKNIHIAILGHVCCVRANRDGYNKLKETNTLSYDRARYVCRYLVKHGVDKNRLQYVGYGGSRKIYKDESTAQNRQKNRRVEMVITMK